KGIYIFPCIGEGERRKQPCPGIGWLSKSTIDPRQIKMWWNRWPTAVPAIPCGQNGFLVLDCDRKLNDSLAWVKDTLSYAVDRVPGCTTPSGGRHLYYRNIDPPFGNGRGLLPAKSEVDLDIR